MKVTYLGHGSFHVEIGATQIVFDPFISPNALAKDIAVDSLKADYILLTHAHQDHIVDVEAIAKNNDAVIVAPYEVASHYGGKGFKYHPMNHGGKWKFDFGTVKLVCLLYTSPSPRDS